MAVINLGPDRMQLTMQLLNEGLTKGFERGYERKQNELLMQRELDKQKADMSLVNQLLSTNDEESNVYDGLQSLIPELQSKAGLDYVNQLSMQTFKGKQELNTRLKEIDATAKAKSLYDTSGNNSSLVQSSQILEDGTSITVKKNGQIEVRDAANTILEGDDAKAAIKAANEQRIANARATSAGRAEAVGASEAYWTSIITANRGMAEKAVTASEKAFQATQPVYQQINRLREVVDLVRNKNAKSGIIWDRLPSLRESSRQLDRLQRELGLDTLKELNLAPVSDADIALALSAGLPKRELSAPELATWAERKISALEKTAAYLEGASMFLGSPKVDENGKVVGVNGVQDFVKYLKETKGTTDALAPDAPTPPPVTPPPTTPPAGGGELNMSPNRLPGESAMDFMKRQAEIKKRGGK